MDNEDQVKDLVPDSKSVFLRDEAIKQAKRESYQLDKEFAKTKKNKSPFVLLTIILFVAVFAAAAILVTIYIQNKTKNVPVDIADFADVNLKDILDKAKQYENQMEKAQRDLDDITTEMNTKIEEIRQNADQDIRLVRTKQLSTGEERRQIAAIEQNRDAGIEKIKAEYADRINAKKAEIADIQAKIDQYDTKKVQQAKEQEAILNNQQKKYELEMKQTTDYYEKKISEIETARDQEIKSLKSYHESYVKQINSNHASEIARLTKKYEDEIARINKEHADEIAKLKADQAEAIRQLILKYNPIFSSPALQSVLKKAVGDGPPPEVKLGAFRQVLQDEEVISKKDFNTLRTNISDSLVLIDRLLSIPYTNSIPAALQHIKYAGAESFRTYENMWKIMASKLEAKNKYIGHVEYAFESLLKSSRENGYVLDARDPNSIQVFLDKIHEVRDGDLGYVFRQDDEMIATIKFSVKNGNVTASLVEYLAEDAAIRPFDKILIQVK